MLSQSEPKLIQKMIEGGRKNRLPLISPTWAWMVALILAFASIRGILVINFDVSLDTIKAISFISVFSLALCGWVMMPRNRHPDLVWLKNLIKLNFLLGAVNLVIDFVLGVPFDLSLLYIYLAPFAVFLLLRLPLIYFNVVIVVVTIAIGGSVAGNFYESGKGADGWQSAIDYNTKLKPEETETLGRSRTGNFFRASGYTGNPHDSANILGMMASFFFIRFLLKKKMADIGLFLFALMSLLMTQSATNILVAVLTLLIFTGYVLIQRPRKSTLYILLLSLIGVSVLIAYTGDLVTIFTARLGEDGDWQGATRELDMGTLLASSPFILVGHAAAFGSGGQTEISLIKIIYDVGIIHAAIIFGILLYPTFRFSKSKVMCMDALPSVAATFFAFMSLLHYGSMFRVTSIFLFYAFCAISLNHIIGGFKPQEQKAQRDVA